MICAMVLALAVSADGPGLARKLIDDFKFTEAIKVIGDNLKKPSDRQRLVRLHELEGIAWSALNRTDQARAAFARLLTLDPQREPPQELSPRARTSFLAARTLARREPLSLVVSPSGRDESLRLTSLSVRYQTSSLLPASVLRVSTSSDGSNEVQVTKPITTPVGEVTVPLSARGVQWTVDLLDNVGSVLATTSGSEAAPALVLPPPPPPPVAVEAVSAPAAPSVQVRPAGVVVAGVGLAAAAVGVVFAVMTGSNRARLANPPLNADGTVNGLTQVEAARLRDSLPTTAALATGLLIGGSLAMVAGTLLAFVGTSSAPVSVQVSPLGVSLSARW